MGTPNARPRSTPDVRNDVKALKADLAQLRRLISRQPKPAKIPPSAGGLAIGITEAESSGFYDSNPDGADLNTWNIKPYDWIPNSRPPALTPDRAFFRVVEAGWYMLSVQISFMLGGDVPSSVSALITSAGDSIQTAAETRVPTYPSAGAQKAMAYISTQPAYVTANAGIGAGIRWPYGSAVSVQSGYGYFYIVRIA